MIIWVMDKADRMVLARETKYGRHRTKSTVIIIPLNSLERNKRGKKDWNRAKNRARNLGCQCYVHSITLGGNSTPKLVKVVN